MVDASPLFDKEVKVHHLPFDLDLNFFSPNFTKKARERFGISKDTKIR